MGKVVELVHRLHPPGCEAPGNAKGNLPQN